MILKKLKTIAFTLAAFGFLFSASLTSCGNKKVDGESTELPADQEADHPEGEHPADTTGGEHPADTTGGEHPDN